MNENFLIYTQKDCKYSDEIIALLKKYKESIEVKDVYAAHLHHQFASKELTRTPIVYYRGRLIPNGYAWIRDAYAGTPIDLTHP